MKIKSIKNTGSYCPSQWEGITDKNEAIYIRYRWGRLSIYLSAPDGTIEDAINENKVLYSKQISSDEYDGFIELEEVLEIIEREGL
jgi:NAD dependent epimerase/dehydratase family enzyme